MRIGQTTRSGKTARILLSTLLVSSMGVASVQAARCYEEGLRAPLGYYQIPEPRDSGSYDCKIVDPHRGSMHFNSKYKGSDSARNELNEEAYQAYLEASETIRNFEKTVIASANDYQVDGDGPGARDCVIKNLESWAQAGALLPEDINHVGQAVRKWALAAAANAYLRVKLSSAESALEPARLARIEAWFGKVADGVREYYTDREPEKVNNHDYWAAWAVMSTAVATKNCGHWNWSMAKFSEAMEQISVDGYLPKELSREDRALEYLNYAMQPLTLIAVFAEINSVPVHDKYGDGLTRLARNVVSGLEDSADIQAITGYEQITDGLYTAWGLAWMLPWAETWGELTGVSEFMTDHGPVKNTRLGGDIQFLYGVKPRWTTPYPPTDLRINGELTQ